ncbi:MAG TPA: hypothetical protein VLH15_12070, partial [Dehalococcoidales bacterium]|nr:hypothetical protein [Dehalococcoidales bacterium]
GGVVEIKGRQMELPLALRRLKILDTEWTRFSKYGNCLDACLHDPGNMAGYWPSGRPNLT